MHSQSSIRHSFQRTALCRERFVGDLLKHLGVCALSQVYSIVRFDRSSRSMGSMAGVAVAPPSDHPPTSQVDNRACRFGRFFHSRVCHLFRARMIIRPGLVAVAEFSTALRVRFPVPDPQRCGSRPPRVLRDIGLGRSRLGARGATHARGGGGGCSGGGSAD